MRRLLLALVVLLALIAGLIALAAARLDSYLDANRAWMESQAEARIGRRVSFDSFRVSFGGGLAVEVANLRVGAGPTAESGDLLRAERLQVRLRILPAVFGRYEISRIVLDHPKVTVVRSATGVTVDSGRSDAEQSGANTPASPEAGVGPLAALVVSAVEIRDGEILLIDRTLTPPGEVRIRALDVDLSDVALTTPVNVNVAAAVFDTDEHDVKLTGTIGPLLASDRQSVRPRDELPIDVRIEAGPLTIGDLRREPQLARALPPSLADGLTVQLQGTARGTPAALKVNGSLELGDSTVQVEAQIEGSNLQGSIRSPRGTAGDVAYTDLTADLQVRDGQLTVQRFTVSTLGGACNGAADYDPRNPAQPAFHFQSTARDLAVADLLALSRSKDTPKMTGRLDANADLRGAGTDRAAIEATLAGQTRVDVRNGVLKDVNVGEQVLRRLTGTPGLTNLISDRVRSKYPGIFSSGDTRFDTLSGTARIGQGRATTDDLILATRDYTLRGKGWVGFDNRLRLDATLVASSALTADLIASAKEVSILSNDQGQIEIPVTLSGKMPHLEVTPDPAFVARTLGRALQTGMDSLLRSKKRRDRGKPDATPRPEVDLLRKGLDSLFRGKQ